MSSHVEKIKEKLSIVDVIGSYIELEKAGGNFKAKCPFHNEKTPSFFISPARNTYYCFGCGAKGDIFSFVQEFEGLDFVGALRVLAKRAGVELERENPSLRTERERLYLTLEHATLFFQRQLGAHTQAKDYLKKRGLVADTVRTWRLGYAPVEWKALYTYLKTKGVRAEDMERVGLIKKSEKTQGDYYDRFRGRIMFPIFDASGRVVAFSGRQFESDGTQAKYINSPETVLFEKSKILYGYDKAKLEIRRQDFALLVEGQMDLLMSHQSGIGNAVASSGTALTTEQLEILKRLSKKLVIAYDGDEAGLKAAARGWQLALAAGMEIKIATLPDGKDPADVCLENPEIFKDAIKHARHIIDVELERIIKKYSDPREQGLAVQNELLPYVAGLDSSIEKSHFISEIAHKARIKENILWEEVRKREKDSLYKREEAPQQQPHTERSRRASILRMLFAIMFWQERQDKKTIDPLDMREKLCNTIGKEAVAAHEKKLQGIEDELVFEAEVSYEGSPQLPLLINELLTNLKEEHLRDLFAEKMSELQQAEREKNTDKVLRLLKECQDISIELRTITESSQH